MRIRFRILLPLIFGFITIWLIAWEVHNEHVIEQMGMAWDTGAPVWPYQASWLLMLAINAPAYVLATPLFSLLHLQTLDSRLPSLLVVALVWWWWLGTRIDFGVLGRRHYRSPRPLASFLLMTAALLIGAGTYGIWDEYKWWRSWGYQLSRTDLLVLLRTIGPVFWAMAVASGCVLASVRLFQGRFAPVSVPYPRHPLWRVGAGFTLLLLGALSLMANIPTTLVDRNSCIANSSAGCIHGTIADDNGRPVAGLEVEVFPADEPRDRRWQSKSYTWTDELGRYSFDQLKPGEYRLGVHYFDAPDADHPFASSFYPGVHDEAEAGLVEVRANSRTMLNELRLRSLPLTTVTIEVIWSDGSHPRWSNLLFHNVNYPDEGVIGGVAPGVQAGHGEMTLPVGFEYTAQAVVDCDAGTQIEFRESTPPHRVRIESHKKPEKLTFILPGAPCPLWSPK